MTWVSVKGVVVREHGVASGGSKDPRFPGGTVSMQGRASVVSASTSAATEVMTL